MTILNQYAELGIYAGVVLLVIWLVMRALDRQARRLETERERLRVPDTRIEPHHISAEMRERLDMRDAAAMPPFPAKGIVAIVTGSLLLYGVLFDMLFAGWVVAFLACIVTLHLCLNILGE